MPTDLFAKMVRPSDKIFCLEPSHESSTGYYYQAEPQNSTISQHKLI
jgi:hypothetical protein